MRHKKRILVLLCLLLLLGTIPITASTKEVMINEDLLNIRSGPGTNFEKLGQVNKGDIFPMLDQAGNWVEIQLDGYTGWVSTDYVSLQGEITSETDSNVIESDKQLHITIPYAHTQIRNGPSTDDEIVYFAKEGEKLPLLGESDNWYKVKSENSDGYVSKKLVEEKVDTHTEGMKGKTIVIDPGHGGNDSGAISASEALEKDITYKTAEILSQELSLLGAEVLMTRDQGTFATLASRATLANVENADAFISLHYNSTPNLPDVTGISTYYYHEHYESLAKYIQEEIIKETGDRDRGSGFGDFQVIRQNLKPGVLIELGFISNPDIDQLLATNAYQKKLVSGIVNGLQKYYAIQK